MIPRSLDVLSRLDLHPTEENEDVWQPTRTHVDGLHPEVVDEVNRLLGRLADPAATNPQGIVIQGSKGVGKTHLVRCARERVEALDGYFVLVRLRSGSDFWQDALDGLLDSLDRRNQLERLLDRLAVRARVPATVKTAVCGAEAPSKQDLDRFTVGLREHDRAAGTQASDVARALALAVSTGDLDAQDTGRAYLKGTPGFEKDLAHWGIRTPAGSPQVVLHQLTMLMALTGPSLFAVDQMDPLLALSRTSSAPEARDRAAGSPQHAIDHQHTIDQVALGLMELREEARRSVTVVACLPATWNELSRHAISSTEDRFIVTRQLRQLPSADVARALVERRLTDHYSAEEFDPPYPSWPVTPRVFEKAADRYTPRRLLIRIRDHVRACVLAGVVTELKDLTESADPAGADVPAGPIAVPVGDGPAHVTPAGVAIAGGRPDSRAAGLDVIDRRWSELLEAADPAPALAAPTDDAVLPGLLFSALTALVRELQQDGQEFQVDQGTGPRPRVHARLRLLVSEETEQEQHWSFRGIAAAHHRAVQPRLRDALAESGLEVGGPARALVVLRNQPWPGGRITTELVTGLRAAGGQELALTGDDVRRMIALQGLLEENPAHLDVWLGERRPAAAIEIFRKALGGRLPLPPPGSGDCAPMGDPQASGPAPPAVVRLGTTLRDRKPFDVPVELLRKHVLVVAGSGAGKTVLLKRLVEEAALHGVSSVVLDPNNDLSRLGQPWPQPPPGWHDGDSGKAHEYFAATDVVVWTPRRSAGRPLSFEPLPDLAAFRHDPDEFSTAVETAVAVLAPKAKVAGDTYKASVARAVLTAVLRHCGQRTDGGLDALIDLLEDVPDEASEFEESQLLARSMATALRAARVTDPLFGSSEGHTDAAELITPGPGRSARVSVVNFVGLPRLDQRQSFVSQLQLALFATMSRHPTQRALGALLVMDEAQDFAPAQGKTPSTESTLRLAAQARKFGLGLAFATQAPRSLHNGVAGNTATQFIGRLTHPTQIETVADLARRRGGDVPDVARLDRGQFYASTEGTTMRKISVPLPLSHHPAGPPSEEEVLRIARAEQPRPV